MILSSRSHPFLLTAAVALGTTGSAFAQEVPPAAPDSGDTAWMLTSTVLVLLMTLPGLALFYGGLVRAKNVLSILVQCFVIAALMSVLWVVFGYSLATTGDGPFLGNFSKAFLGGIEEDSLSGTIPESVFATFQMTFVIITPALMVGAFVERIRDEVKFDGVEALVEQLRSDEVESRTVLRHRDI